MPTDFAEPYPTDPTDRISAGRLLFAANHGDQRAQATIQAANRAATADTDGHTEEAAKPNKGSVKAGRLLYGRRTHQEFDIQTGTEATDV